MKRKIRRATRDDLDRLIERHRQVIPDFDSLLAKELIDLDLALAIATARKEQHLSQRALARRAGITQAMVARLENPENVSATVKTLATLALALGCHLRIEFEPQRISKTRHRHEETKAAA